MSRELHNLRKVSHLYPEYKLDFMLWHKHITLKALIWIIKSPLSPTLSRTAAPFLLRAFIHFILPKVDVFMAQNSAFPFLPSAPPSLALSPFPDRCGRCRFSIWSWRPRETRMRTRATGQHFHTRPEVEWIQILALGRQSQGSHCTNLLRRQKWLVHG